MNKAADHYSGLAGGFGRCGFFPVLVGYFLAGPMGLVAGVPPIGKRTMGVTMHSLVRQVSDGAGSHFLGGVYRCLEGSTRCEGCV